MPFKERPILFSPSMVRAILDGHKTQTRRCLKESWQLLPFEKPAYVHDALEKCPYGVPGDRLWAREAWSTHANFDHLNGTELGNEAMKAGWKKPWAPVAYMADGTRENWDTFGGNSAPLGRYRHARFMPRWASRITLEITDVRVRRLQDISGEDAIAEGVEPNKMTAEDIADIQISDSAPHIKELARLLGPGQFGTKFAYQMLWDSINGKKHPWSSNPWVWVLGFKKVTI